MRAFKILVLALLFFYSQLSLAAAADFTRLQCDFLKASVLQFKIEENFIPVIIESDAGGFIQVRVADSGVIIQYQILIENEKSKPGMFLVLQNLKVGELESSSEFLTSDLSFLKISQGEIEFRCSVQL